MTATEVSAVAAETAFDLAKAEAFGGHMMGILGGGLLTMMVDIGHRTGLFAAAAEGWATSEQLAARAGLNERYVAGAGGERLTAACLDEVPGLVSEVRDSGGGGVFCGRSRSAARRS